MHSLIRNTLIHGKMSKEWSKAVLFLLIKKGDGMICKTYRDIAILNIAYKILAIISNEMNKIVEKGKGSNGSNFCLKRITNRKL